MGHIIKQLGVDSTSCSGAFRRSSNQTRSGDEETFLHQNTASVSETQKLSDGSVYFCWYSSILTFQTCGRLKNKPFLSQPNVFWFRVLFYMTGFSKTMKLFINLLQLTADLFRCCNTFIISLVFPFQLCFIYHQNNTSVSETQIGRNWNSLENVNKNSL